ncbi:hypothetical protein EYD10_00592 [Varanus komodoensis]|nr:hypothetical protein EYD10_00592 [Varanus komodoensis]
MFSFLFMLLQCSYSIRHSISMPAMRNSPTFKSFEEKVESTVTSLKVVEFLLLKGPSPSLNTFLKHCDFPVLKNQALANRVTYNGELTKVGGTSHPGGSFEEVLSSTAHASAQSSIAGTRLSEAEEELQC